MGLPHVRHCDREVIPGSSENIWTDNDRERVRSHLVEFFVIGNLVQVLEQPLQQIEICGGKFAEEVPDFCQTRFETFNSLNTA